MTKDRQQAPDKARRGWRGPTVARFLGQAAIWGSSFTLIKIALDAVSPSQLVVARLVLGAVALAIVARASGGIVVLSGMALAAGRRHRDVRER